MQPDVSPHLAAPARPARRPNTIQLMVALAASTVLATACGDTDEPTAQDYLRQGNAICVDIDKQVQEALPSFDGPPTVEQVQQVATDLAPVLRSLRTQLAELQPPDELQAEHDNLLDEIGAAATSLDEAANDENKAEELSRTGPPIEEMSAAAVDMGLAGCS